MSSAAPSPASPPASPGTRYNFDPALPCPRCFREAGSLSRSAADRGLYRCAGCSARFRFEVADDAQAATLVHVLWTDEEWNAGARQADDWRCPGCNARGFIVFCGSCTQDLYSGARR